MAFNQIPIAPTVDAQSFPELAQRPTTSTAVVPFKAVVDLVSIPGGSESDSGTDTDADDAVLTSSEAVSKPLKKKKKKESREFRDQQKQSQKRAALSPLTPQLRNLSKICPM